MGNTLKKEVQKAAGVIEYGREDSPASPKDENEDEYENEINTDGTLKIDSFNYTDTAEPIRLPQPFHIADGFGGRSRHYDRETMLPAEPVRNAADLPIIVLMRAMWYFSPVSALCG